MFRTVVRTYAVLSILFVIALAVFFVARLTVIRDGNIDASAQSFSAIRQRAEQAVTEAESAAETKELMRPRSSSDRLEAVILYAVGDGVSYLWARSPQYTEGGFTGGTGVPQLSYNDLTQIKFTATVGEENPYVLEALFTVLERNDLYPLLRISLIAVLGVALIATLLAIIGAQQGRPERRPVAAPPPPEEVPPAPKEEKSRQQRELPRGAESPDKDSLFGPSGLSREEYLLKRLSLELERAAYNEQDLTLLVLEYEGQQQYDERYLLHARQLLNHFGFEDLAFENGPRYVVVFPNTTLREGLTTVERYKKEILDSGPTTEHDHPYAGLSSRNGRLIDGKRLLSEAMVALNKSHDTPGRILGFEPDPEKYRAAL
jgi:hypothetical protein